MEVLMLTVFASVALGASAVLFFAWNVRQRSHEHSEHLALLPLADDERAATKALERTEPKALERTEPKALERTEIRKEST